MYLTICVGKSTYARCGIIVNVTPFEPEWEGFVTLEISNTTPLPAKIYANEGLCQILFFQRHEPCETSYADRKGKYQKQQGIVLPSSEKITLANWNRSHGFEGQLAGSRLRSSVGAPFVLALGEPASANEGRDDLQKAPNPQPIRIGLLADEPMRAAGLASIFDLPGAGGSGAACPGGREPRGVAGVNDDRIPGRRSAFFVRRPRGAGDHSPRAARDPLDRDWARRRR